MTAAADVPALSVACPRCDARPGEPCRTAERQTRPPHRRRTKAYLGTPDAITDVPPTAPEL